MKLSKNLLTEDLNQKPVLEEVKTSAKAIYGSPRRI